MAETQVEFLCLRCGAQGLARAVAAGQDPADGADGSGRVSIGEPSCPRCGSRLRAYKVRLQRVPLAAAGV